MPPDAQNPMDKYICIHGHFYQPPRENPWLEAVELQDSAYPYHDWNDRIAAECYGPNSAARLLDGNGRIERIVNNFSRISFNFGPTLLFWMEEKSPEIYQAILEADKEGRKKFSGHGPAIAQSCHHSILPLANARDKYTEVLWGLRDFEHRFQRQPEGMWLPETAADNETLEVLAGFGIKFVILSPFQASRVRPLEDDAGWQDVNGAKVDPTMPYRVNLPSGKSIAAFFYDAPVSQAVAFERLLENGGRFSKKLLGAFDDNRKRPQLVHIATDGESYGHHFRYGEMALAYALQSIETGGEAGITVYGEFLEKHPPTHEAEIHQASAWSCSHGVDRWRRNCGCNSGGHGGWNQHWREPLREAMNWLRDQIAPRYEARARGLFKDPWQARNEYIQVLEDRSPEKVDKFLNEQAGRELKAEEQIAALRLLEMQRHALLMFTSCGWFFDEISGLESVQVIQYAARAIQLANGVPNDHLEAGFLDILSKAKSNLPENRDGRYIYETFVRPALMTRESVGAHYAISSLFESYPERARIYAFTVQQLDRQLFTAGHARLAIGRINVIFEQTRNSDMISYAVIHMGEHNLNCGVRHDGSEEEHQKMVKDLKEAFDRADFPEIVRSMDRHFGESRYSLRNLFRDEQNKVLNQILTTSREEIQNTYHLITDRYAPLMRFLSDSRLPALKGLAVAMEVVLNSELRRQFDAERLDLERVRSLLAECEASKVPLAKDVLAYALKGHLERLSEQLVKSPEDLDGLQRYVDAAKLAHEMPFEANLRKPQDAYYQMLTKTLPEMQDRAKGEDPKTAKAGEWVSKFLTLGEQLGFQIEQYRHPAATQ
jgi:alpha-amylase/alpha-mannosidase (GH57 family)